MRRVVDGRDAEADDKVDQDYRQYPCANGSLEKRRNRLAISNPKHQKNTKQAKDGARCARRYRLRVIEVASKHSCNARDNIKEDEALASIQLLHLRSDHP